MTADMRSVVSEEIPQSVALAAGRPDGIDGAPRPFPYGQPQLPVDGPRSSVSDSPNGTPPDAAAEPRPVPVEEWDATPDWATGPDATAGSGEATPDGTDREQTHDGRDGQYAQYAQDDGTDGRWAGDASNENEPVSGELVDGDRVGDASDDAEPVVADLVDADPVFGDPVDPDPVSGDLVVADPVFGDLVVAEPVEEAPAAGEVVAEEVVAAEVAAQLGAVVGDDIEADPAEFAAAAVLDVLRASGWADAAEASELRAESARTKELLNMVVRDHRAREASAAGSVNQQLHWLVPLLRAAHGVAFGSLGAKVALRTAVQDVPPDVLLQAGLRIDYGVEHAVTDEERQAPPLN